MSSVLSCLHMHDALTCQQGQAALHTVQDLFPSLECSPFSSLLPPLKTHPRPTLFRTPRPTPSAHTTLPVLPPVSTVPRSVFLRGMIMRRMCLSRGLSVRGKECAQNRTRVTSLHVRKGSTQIQMIQPLHLQRRKMRFFIYKTGTAGPHKPQKNTRETGRPGQGYASSSLLYNQPKANHFIYTSFRALITSPGQ